MSTTTTNFGWTVPSDTDLVKDGAAAIRTALGGVDTSFVDLKGGTTGQVLSKASGTDLDFTWVAQDDSNAIQNAIVDAKGDLIAATAADTPARLAVGTNGQVLTADSAEATGMKWATPASTGGMTLLSNTSITATQTITISPISGSYNELLVVMENFAFNSANDTLMVRFNSDSGSNYDQLAYQPNYGVIATGHPATEMLYGQVNNIKGTNNATFAMRIPLYASSTGYKTGMASLAAIYGGTSNIFTVHGTFAYKSTSAITSVSLGGANNQLLAQGSIKVWGIN